MTGNVVELRPRRMPDPRETLVAEIVERVLVPRGFSKEFRQFTAEKMTAAVMVKSLDRWFAPLPMSLPVELEPQQAEAIAREVGALLAAAQRDYLVQLLFQAKVAATMEWQLRELGFEAVPIHRL